MLADVLGDPFVPAVGDAGGSWCSRCFSKGAVRAKICFFQIPHQVQSCRVVSEE